MTRRSEMLALARDGVPFEEIGRRFAMAPGRAYLVTLGRPADGSGAVDDRDPHELGVPREPSTQHLCNPPSVSVVSRPAVHRWIEQRARRDLSEPRAGRGGPS